MDNRKEVEDYLDRKVNPLLEEVTLELAKSKPKNILKFCRLWFEKKIQSQERTQKNIAIDSETDSDEETLSEQLIADKKSKMSWFRHRNAICGEVFGNYNKIDESELQTIEKTVSVNNRILFRVKSLFLFKEFDDEDTSRLISTMREVTFKEDTVVIRQGDEGNEIFIVDSGELHCYRNCNNEEVYIKTICEGEMFGEISMLYNTKRSAHIRAKTDSTCFILDRKTFNAVTRQKIMRRRGTVAEIMTRIDIFKELEREETFKIQDIVKEMPVHLNQYVLREGKPNSKIFLVDKGKLVSLKKEKNGHEKITAHLKDGDHFGVSSVVNREPSGISVMALTTSKLFYICSQDIERIIGPMSKLLQRNVEIFQKYKLAF